MALIRATFLVPQVLGLDHYFGCNLHYAKLRTNSHWRNDVIPPEILYIPRLGWGESAARGTILLLSRPPTYTSYFCLVSRNYLTSGWFSWCKLFLLANSYIFWTCSNPGLASLSCTVKIKHPRHNPRSDFCLSRISDPGFNNRNKRGEKICCSTFFAATNITNSEIILFRKIVTGYRIFFCLHILTKKLTFFRPLPLPLPAPTRDFLNQLIIIRFLKGRQSASNFRIINPRSRPYLEVDICSDTIGIWKIFFLQFIDSGFCLQLKKTLKGRWKREKWGVGKKSNGR
jgi:hypothetical protein